MTAQEKASEVARNAWIAAQKKAKEQKAAFVATLPEMNAAQKRDLLATIPAQESLNSSGLDSEFRYPSDEKDAAKIDAAIDKAKIKRTKSLTAQKSKAVDVVANAKSITRFKLPPPKNDGKQTFEVHGVA